MLVLELQIQHSEKHVYSDRTLSSCFVSSGLSRVIPFNTCAICWYVYENITQKGTNSESHPTILTSDV